MARGSVFSIRGGPASAPPPLRAPLSAEKKTLDPQTFADDARDDAFEGLKAAAVINVKDMQPSQSCSPLACQ